MLRNTFKLARGFSSAAEGSIVVTVTGSDKSGVLAEISRAVESVSSTSIETQKLTRLCGDFAVIMKVNSTYPHADKAIADALRSTGFDVRTRVAAPAPKAGEVRKMSLRQNRSQSANASSLLKSVSDYLCSLGVKVEALDSTTRSGLVEMNGTLRIPPQFPLSTAEVVAGLNKLGVHANYLDLEVGP